MLFIDSGARLSEIAGLKVDDLDLERNNTALVMGKGRLPRAIAFEAQTAMALDRYLRVRNQRADRAAPDLWLGKYGPMKASGLAQLIRRRGARRLGSPSTRTCFATRWRTTSWPTAELRAT